MLEEETAISGIRRSWGLFRGGASEAEARKEREKEVIRALDGDGRNKQINIRCRLGTLMAVKKDAKAKGLSIAEWFERGVEKILSEAR
jgi:hypothetical protein